MPLLVIAVTLIVRKDFPFAEVQKAGQVNTVMQENLSE